jgi:hypothetical protein
MSIRLWLVMALVTMLAIIPGKATAQKPTDNVIADSYFNFEASPSDTAAVQTRRHMATSAGRLLEAENLYFLQNGRYTARMQDLKDFAPSPDINLLVTAGTSWLSIRAVSAVSPSLKEMHTLAWRTDGPKVESGHFSKVVSTGQR